MNDAAVILVMLYVGWIVLIILVSAYMESSKRVLVLTLTISALISSGVLVGSGILDNLRFIGDLILVPNIFMHWVIYSTIDKRGTSETPFLRFERYRLRKKVERIYERYSILNLFRDYYIGEVVLHAKADRLSPSDVAFKAIMLHLDSVVDKENICFEYLSNNNFEEVDKIIYAYENERKNGKLNIQIYKQCTRTVSLFKERFHI